MSAPTICWAVPMTPLRPQADEGACCICRCILRRDLSMPIPSAGFLAGPCRPGTFPDDRRDHPVLHRKHAAQGFAGGPGGLSRAGMELAVYPPGPAAYGAPCRFAQRPVHHADADGLCPANGLRGQGPRFVGRFFRKSDVLRPALSAGALSRPDRGDDSYAEKRRIDPR